MESFEWYADFEDLIPHLQDGLIQGDSQRILVPGCGNSLLSEKLCTVMNQTNVTSVDFISDVVVKMNERGVSGVTYAEMDFLNMTYEDNTFDTIIDKGSFDAICLDSEAESKDTYSKYLAEQCRVLDSSTNGKFLVVSLLQAHVLDALLDFFVRGTQNPLFENYCFDLQISKLDKICNV